MAPLAVPALVRQHARAAGPPGERWLAGLDDLVAGAAADWDLVVGQPYDGGTASFLSAVTCADGTSAVLKVVMSPADGRPGALAREAAVLRAVDGRGCARLIAADLERGLLLLERLGGRLVDRGLPVAAELDVLVAALSPVWAATTPPGLPSGAEEAAALAATVEQGAADPTLPCPSRLLDVALDCARRRRRGHDPRRAVLVHGDAHQWNALQDPACPGGYRLVDPDGLVADREYDLAVVLREHTADLLAGDTARLGRERAASLAARGGCDPQVLWEWAVLLLTVNGLLWHHDGEPDLAAGNLDAARLLAADVTP